VYNKGSRNTLSRKAKALKNISFSANTFAERVNDFTGDIQCQLKEKRKILWRILLQLTRAQTLKILQSLLFLFEALMRTLN
jgi:DNA-binding ferritin-like protein (Dps family)